MEGRVGFRSSCQRRPPEHVNEGQHSLFISRTLSYLGHPEPLTAAPESGQPIGDDLTISPLSWVVVALKAWAAPGPQPSKMVDSGRSALLRGDAGSDFHPTVAAAALKLGEHETLAIEEARPGSRFRPFRFRKPRYTRENDPPIVCGRCETPTPAPFWRCPICNAPLCDLCGDELGHCGHTEGEIANRRGTG